MVQRFYKKDIPEPNGYGDEEQYVSLYDFDWERSKCDSLQRALRKAIEMISVTWHDEHNKVGELKALCNMKRSDNKLDNS